MKLSEAKHFLPFVQAATEGKVIQIAKFLCPEDGVWEDTFNCDFSGPPNCYRIKPTPKLRPWKPEEVPVGALIKDRDRDDCFRTIISGVNLIGEISHATGVNWTPKQELNEFLHSTDRGLSWKPCGVLCEE